MVALSMLPYLRTHINAPVEFRSKGENVLDTLEFADALRLAVKRSGLCDGRSIEEAGYVSIAGTILDYLKSNLEVTLPAEAIPTTDEKKSGSDIKCRIS